MNDQQLTLLIAKRLLQHGEDDRVVQHKIAEVAGSCGAESGIANKRVFVQQTAGGGSPAGRRESSQHLHDAGEHHRRTSRDINVNNTTGNTRRKPQNLNVMYEQNGTEIIIMCF